MPCPGPPSLMSPYQLNHSQDPPPRCCSVARPGSTTFTQPLPVHDDQIRNHHVTTTPISDTHRSGGHCLERRDAERLFWIWMDEDVSVGVIIGQRFLIEMSKRRFFRMRISRLAVAATRFAARHRRRGGEIVAFVLREILHHIDQQADVFLGRDATCVEKRIDSSGMPACHAFHVGPSPTIVRVN